MNISRTFLSTLVSTSLLVLTGCGSTSAPLAGYEELSPTTVLPVPETPVSDRYPVETLARGKYLVSLLRCGACHTEGALTGQPDAALRLAGSSTGIATSSPMDNQYPGVVYPPNLTPDPGTGLGEWSDQQVVNMIRTGTNRHGRRAISVMPSAAYAVVTEADALAIAAYLKSLPPVRHAVPANVPPGQKARAPFVYFGVYRSKP